MERVHPGPRGEARRTLRWACLLVLSAGFALAAPQQYEVRSYVNLGVKVQPAFAWCDAPGRVLAVTQPAKPPTTPQPASLVTWLKGARGSPDINPVQLGPSDVGAGNVYTALTPPGAAVPATPSSYVHTSNVENVNDPAYRMTRVNEFRLDGHSHRCRYQPQAVFMGVTTRRTVIVWDNGQTATYATRNFDGTPGVYVTGGLKNGSVKGGSTYDFSTGDGFKYRVVEHSQGSNSGAFLTVTKAASLKGIESFLAYSVSLPVKVGP